MSKTFSEIIARAHEIADKYDEFNTQKAGQKWNSQDHMMGFSGDVGDLSKLVMAKNGVREIADVDEKLVHELADCLWSVIVLARDLDIDLEKSFAKTMNELDARIDMELDK
jgi:NTP pyrophosphatase (non-canonical NTP hydrolase)